MSSDPVVLTNKESDALRRLVRHALMLTRYDAHDKGKITRAIARRLIQKGLAKYDSPFTACATDSGRAAIVALDAVSPPPTEKD